MVLRLVEVRIVISGASVIITTTAAGGNNTSHTRNVRILVIKILTLSNIIEIIIVNMTLSNTIEIIIVNMVRIRSSCGLGRILGLGRGAVPRRAPNSGGCQDAPMGSFLFCSCDVSGVQGFRV